MVINPIYTPLSSLWSARGKQQWVVHHHLVRLAMKLVVAQFCRAMDHEIISEGADCEWSENHRRRNQEVRGGQGHPNIIASRLYMQHRSLYISTCTCLVHVVATKGFVKSTSSIGCVGA